MNTGKSEIEPYKSLQILDELAHNDSLTQRDLSDKLGIALGLVNSYIKNLVIKGFITVKSIPSKRYAYYLTPKGFTEKSRLAYHLLSDYTRIYREAKANLNDLFKELQQSGVKRILFAGADEVTEIAFITMQDSDLVLVDVIDDEKKGKKIFGKTIRSIEDVNDLEYDCIVITSYVRRESIRAELTRRGVAPDKIKMIF